MKTKEYYLCAIRLFLLIGTPFLLLSCAATEHNVNTGALQQSKDRLFHVGSIEVPCGNGGLYERDQVALLDSTPVNEVCQALIDTYGLNIETKDNFSLKNYPISWQGLVPGLGGRCFYRENASYDKNGDVINIAFTFSDKLSLPPQTTLCYKIIVKSSGTELMKHKGEIESFEKHSSNPFSNDLSRRILKAVAKLPDTLRRDFAPSNVQESRPVSSAEDTATPPEAGEAVEKDNSPNKSMQPTAGSGG